MGTYHKRLEETLKEYLGVPELSLMVNGHMALELAIQSFDFPEGSEVITTPFTFISTTHAIVRNRLKPVFCDVKEEDGTIDETKIEDLITEHTVAIVPVHVYGDASIFSFHATKVFNTIEGGAVTFSDHKMYEKLYNLKNFGIRGEELVTSVGANAKMNEFCAIMGLCNLKHLDEALKNRQERYNYYRQGLEKVKGICFFATNTEATNNFAYFPIIIEDDYGITRDEIYDKFHESNIYARKYFYPITADQACFRNKYKNNKLDVARYISQRVLILPFYEKMQIGTIDTIIQILR